MLESFEETPHDRDDCPTGPKEHPAGESPYRSETGAL